MLALSIVVPALGGPSNPIASTAASTKQIAQKALKKAKTAQTTADQANSKAGAAQTTANDALTKANAAQTSATAAQTSATAANTNANTRFKQTNYIDDGGTATTSNDKTDTATCPAGQKITGGGYFTAGAGTNDITAQYNSAYGDAWLASMEEIGAGTAQTWNVTATAICASK